MSIVPFRCKSINNFFFQNLTCDQLHFQLVIFLHFWLNLQRNQPNPKEWMNICCLLLLLCVCVLFFFFSSIYTSWLLTDIYISIYVKIVIHLWMTHLKNHALSSTIDHIKMKDKYWCRLILTYDNFASFWSWCEAFVFT